MSDIEALLASYLDLAHHLNPLRYSDAAGQRAHHRLGRFDLPSLNEQIVSLRSIANALEDLEDVDELDDEVDRTMLMDTLRGDIARYRGFLERTTADPVHPLRHAVEALQTLMGEDFDAEAESALRERVSSLPEFLTLARGDRRPAPDLLVQAAQRQTQALLDALDLASERLEEAAVQGAINATEAHQAWLSDPARVGGDPGMGEAELEARLPTLVSEPLGAKGTLRLLELRRAGVEKSLTSSGEELDTEDPIGFALALRDETMVSADILPDFWADEWQRVGNEMHALGLPVVMGEPPPPPLEAEDAWSMAGFAVRHHAERMLLTVQEDNVRSVRRLLRPSGLLAGWGRTVAALLRGSPVFGLPERRMMMSYRALIDSVNAESDLLLQGRAASVEELVARTEKLTRLDPEESRVQLLSVLERPLAPLAAALAHEAWQAWYAETGGDPIAFIGRALQGGGLAVPLARWALTAEREN